MAELEAPPPRSREPILLFHADHATWLGADLDRLLLEQDRSTDEADEVLGLIADGIDRIMHVQDFAHGISNREMRVEVEGVTEHDVAHPLHRFRQQQVAHHDDAQQLATLVGHIAVRDERLLHKFPQLRHGFLDGHVGAVHGHGAFHQPPDRAFGKHLIARPLLAVLLGCRRYDLLPAIAVEPQQHLERHGGFEQGEHLGDHRRGLPTQQLHRLLRSAILRLVDQLQNVTVGRIGSRIRRLVLHAHPRVRLCRSPRGERRIT